MKRSKQGATTKACVRYLAAGVAVVGLVLTLIVPTVVRRTSVTCCNGKTKADIVAFEQACKEFFLANGRYPTELEELIRPDVEGRTYVKGTSIPRDPWRRPYCYVPPDREGSTLTIYTLGRDGELGGDGDDADFSNLDLAEEAGMD